MLKQKYRFHSRGALNYLYKNADSYRSKLFAMRTLRTNKQNPRFAVIVSKKVFKRAYGRNRMRRRVYEIIRSELPHLLMNQDTALIIMTSEVMNVPYSELEDNIKQLMSQACLYK